MKEAFKHTEIEIIQLSNDFIPNNSITNSFANKMDSFCEKNKNMDEENKSSLNCVCSTIKIVINPSNSINSLGNNFSKTYNESRIMNLTQRFLSNKSADNFLIYKNKKNKQSEPILKYLNLKEIEINKVIKENIMLKNKINELNKQNDELKKELKNLQEKLNDYENGKNLDKSGEKNDEILFNINNLDLKKSINDSIYLTSSQRMNDEEISEINEAKLNSNKAEINRNGKNLKILDKVRTLKNKSKNDVNKNLNINKIKENEETRKKAIKENSKLNLKKSNKKI
jgi:hypothetical protein